MSPADPANANANAYAISRLANGLVDCLKRVEATASPDKLGGE